MGKWNGRRRKPKGRKVIRKKPEPFASRKYQEHLDTRSDRDQELAECERLDKRMGLEGQ